MGGSAWAGACGLHASPHIRVTLLWLHAPLGRILVGGWMGGQVGRVRVVGCA